MNILFISIAWPAKGQRNLYTDLMDEFIANGHQVIVVGTTKSSNAPGILEKEKGKLVLRVPSGKIRKTSVVTKIISLLTLESKLRREINSQLGSYHFDLIIGATPPITLSKLYLKLKRKFDAPFYLLLKDIWPQESVDLGLIRKYGPAWTFLRSHEVRLYKEADYIGCMSPKGKEYIIEKNPFLDENIVEVCPNSIIPTSESQLPDADGIRTKYNIPFDVTVFLFSGNLGIGHGLNFLVDVIHELNTYKKAFFIIGGSGTQYNIIKKKFADTTPPNALIYKWLPREDYEKILATSDVGLILLYKYSTPQFPSRLSSYLDYSKPVLCAINSETDIGMIIEKEKCGKYILHGDKAAFISAVKYLAENPVEREQMGKNSRALLLKSYTVSHSYSKIINHFI